MIVNIKYLQYAMGALDKSKMSHSHGAVMWSSGEIISTGVNNDKTRINGMNVPSVHAEMDCMRRLKGL